MPRKVGLPKRQVVITRVWSRKPGFTTARATVAARQTSRQTTGQRGEHWGSRPPEGGGGAPPKQLMGGKDTLSKTTDNSGLGANRKGETESKGEKL